MQSILNRNNNMHSNAADRNPLHHISQNNQPHLTHKQQQQAIVQGYLPYNIGLCNENMDPSQNLKFLSKAGINNIRNASSNNLYLRRQHNSICQNLAHLQQQKPNPNAAPMPPLKVEIASTYSSAISSANSSYIVNNEEFVLSSASSIHSTSIQNGYLSRSRSLSEINFPYITSNNNNTNENKKKLSIKTRSHSLFQKLTNLVKHRNKNHLDDDGDVAINDAMYTPSTGNTPRTISANVTPFAADKLQDYSEDAITRILGQDTFKQDYIAELFEEEKRTNSQSWYNPRAVYLKQRKNAIDWMCQTGIDFALQRSTIYRAVYYFDCLCSCKEVNMCHLQMIAASALLVAIKWNEKEEKVPSLYRLSKATNKLYSPMSFKPMEIKLLNLLNFRLKVALPVDFISYFIGENECIFADDSLDKHTNLHKHEQSQIYLNKFATFFLDLCCQNYKFWNYSPSMMAFAVIIASRRALRITPYFNDKLTLLCRHTPSQVLECFDSLWNEYHCKFPEDAKKAELYQPHGLDHYIPRGASQ